MFINEIADFAVLHWLQKHIKHKFKLQLSTNFLVES